MILELDAGNSRIKWRQLSGDGGATLAAGSVVDETALIDSVAAEERPSMVRLCSVRAPDLFESLRQWVAANWGVPMSVAVVTRECAGVTLGYTDPNRLGADRWLALLAAHNRRAGPQVVVDAGTALTIDPVDGSGKHLGGFILPGRQLMADSLQRNTRIRLGSLFGSGTELGNDTESAVLNGILASQVALVKALLADLSCDGGQYALTLTGGDAATLADHLTDTELEVVPSLVLDGLAYACPESVVGS